MKLRALEPHDLPALEALCAVPEIAAELDGTPTERALQGAPGVHAALGAFEGAQLLAAAGMSALDRPRMRHQGMAWAAAGPLAAGALLDALRTLAADWWGLDRLELSVPATTRLGPALAAAGFQPEIRRRLDLDSPAGLVDSLGWAWIRPGLAARSSAAPPGPSAPPAGPRAPAALEIRPSTPGDAAAFAEVMGEPAVIWGTLQTPFTPAEVWRTRLVPPDDAGGGSFVAAAGGVEVGYCDLRRAATPRRRHVWGLGMAVRTGWQGRGVGGALMRHLVDLADGMGVPRLELEVYADNARAIALYARHGFVQEGVKRLLAWRGGGYVDGLVMARLAAGCAADERRETP